LQHQQQKLGNHASYAADAAPVDDTRWRKKTVRLDEWIYIYISIYLSMERPMGEVYV